jgi:hypothetical protein
MRFDRESRLEIIRGVKDGPAGQLGREEWTSDYIFENEWQSFRGSQTRALELIGVSNAFPATGRHKAAVKASDIFGNDATKANEVEP